MNVIRREAERALSRVALPQVGIVAGYDPARYAVKVRLQPADVETGWLPLASPWTGNGWGAYFAPRPGDVVDVHFQEGGLEAGYANQRLFSAVTRPLPVPSGECWLVHQSGSKIRFLNDGTIEIVAGQINSTAALWHHTGDMVVSGGISDLDGLHGTLGYLRTAYDSHRHGGVQNGTGATDLTDHPV